MTSAPKTGPDALCSGEHAAVARCARTDTEQANRVHQSVRGTRYHGHFALGFQWNEKIDRLQTTAGNQQRIRVRGGLEGAGAEIVQLILSDCVGGADQVQTLDAQY